MYHYLQQRADSLEVKRLLDQNRDLIAQDQELLDTAYNFYSETGDQQGTRWVIDTMLIRFPSARAHVLNFISSFDQDKSSQYRSPDSSAGAGPQRSPGASRSQSAFRHGGSSIRAAGCQKAL
jgi:hypothetical protein